MRYRWKHRICAVCAWRLNLVGFVSPLGEHVRLGHKAAGGNCGLIHLPGSGNIIDEKVTKIDLPPGAIKLRVSDAPEALRNSYNTGIRRARWIDLQVSDLAKLKCDMPETPLFRLVGPAIAGCNPTVVAKTTLNQAIAAIYRLFRVAPAPDEGLWRWASQFVSEILPAANEPPARMTDEAWLDSMPANRQKVLRQAMLLWKKTAWTAKYELFSSFLKQELVPMFSKDDGGVVPLRAILGRLINAPHDVTHCIAGPVIKPYLGWLKQQWHVNNVLFYGSTTPELLQQWLERITNIKGERLVLWSDYSMYDSSHNKDTWAFVESFYSHHCHDAAFKKVLEAWRAPKGTIGPFKFTGRVMNASGRDDTAFANAILNGVAMLLSICSAWYDVPLLELNIGYVQRISHDLCLSVCGDDALATLPPVTEKRALYLANVIKDNLRRFGFQAKLFTSNRFEDAVYLGHRPILVGGKWYWSKTLGRCLYKFGYQMGTAGDPGAHFMGICKMHQVCSKHVPVLSDIVDTWMNCRKGAKVSPYKEDQNRPWEFMGKFGPKGYDDSTLECLARAYTVDRRPCRQDLAPRDVNVTADDFKELIAYVRGTIQGIPCVLDHWLLEHMVWVDEQ
jgi:hypothetical protein